VEVGGVKIMSMSGFVYFVSNEERTETRVGYDGGSLDRINDHAAYGYSTVEAIVKANQEHEDRIHSHFSQHRVRRGTSRSIYKYDALRPYTERLIEYNYATKEKDRASYLPSIPWVVWGPEAMRGPILDGDQLCLIRTEGVPSADCDTWRTPSREIELCRAAMGSIDTDPATCFEANLFVKAVNAYDEACNGLLCPWLGNVFVNPPYGGREKPAKVEQFVKKLNMEIEAGNTVQAITILNQQSMCTRWFLEYVGRTCSAHAIYNKRIQFIGKGNQHSSSQNGTVFSYFGAEIEQFARVFSPHAQVLIPYGIG
jgi:hypothetical protein